jgi:predicted AAA+ superfamily ATPase
MALDYAMSEQIENLSDVLDRTESEAGDFFDKNHLTQGMEILLSQGLKRLAGRSDQAVFELKQAMGGGKTHSMIALGLLARNAELTSCRLTSTMP